jgi:hypothetical protein
VFITKLSASSLAVKFPGNLDPISVYVAVPGSGLCHWDLQAGDSSFSQTLPQEHPDFNLCLIEPTALVGV